MNNKKYNRTALIYRLQVTTLDAKRLKNTDLYTVFLISIILAGIISLSPVISSLIYNTIIKSSGRIAVTLPLHVEGRYIKDPVNRTVYLRGVWKGAFPDTSTGWWGLDASRWNETALRQTLQTLQQQWGANCINTFIWGDWWLENKAVTLMGGTTDIGLRDAIKRTLQIASEYGIYMQIRLYSPIRAEGRIEGQPYQPYSSWTVDDFVNFWVNVTTELKNYPNVIFTLFDEPTGNISLWFDAATQAINSIRAVGAEQLIVVHWAYCGSCMWMEQWIQEGRPIDNIVFSNHIYRYHGTFGYNPGSPVYIDYIRNFLASKPGATYTGAAYRYIIDTYNVPIWVSAIGAYNGATDDDEYIYFRNTLQVLNEWGLGYVAFHTDRTALAWTLLTPTGAVFDPPNRVGQALIDAIAGVPVPPTYQLTINSNLSRVQFILDGITRRTPYRSKPAFEGSHTVIMPSSTTVYSHFPLFGNTEIGAGGGGYYIYLYTAGPYTINEAITVSTINFFATTAGNAKVALYDELNENPNNLIVASEEEACSANTWHSFAVSDTEILPGEYSLGIKIDTNGMLSDVSRTWFGKYRKHDYELPFPEIFGPVEGVTGSEYSIYVPSAPLQAFTYNFANWEDDSTNPERTINLTTNMTLTATYELYTGS